MRGGTLTLEVGIRCNNRCGHCHQAVLRFAGPVEGEPSTGELLDGIGRARHEGYDEIAFTGGEPTLRRDLPDLIRAARAAGFERASVTTNGRMLSYPAYARTLIEAGLTGISVSLHGPDAMLHDGVTGAPGSFRQAAKGLTVVIATAAAAGVPLQACTITVLTPATLPRLRETLCLAGSLGTRLHILQPFIVSRETLHLAPQHLAGLDELIEGIERAVAGGLPHGGRIKPYNLPPCRLTHLGEVLEVQSYRTVTHKEHEQDSPDHGPAPVSAQHVRIPACSGCEFPCPGIRLEHVTGDAMADGIQDDVLARPAGSRPILGALDLLGARALRRLLPALATAGQSPARVFRGGAAIAPLADLLEACRAADVPEVCHLLRPASIRLPDRHVHLPGNLDQVARDLAAFRAGTAPLPSLMLPLGALFSPDQDIDAGRLDALLDTLAAAGGRRLFLIAPDHLDSDVPVPDAAFLEAAERALPGLVRRWRSRGIEPTLVSVAPPAGRNFHDRVRPFLPVEDWSGQLARHRYSGWRFAWVMASDPIWLYPSS